MNREPIARIEAFKIQHKVDDPKRPKRCWGIRREYVGSLIPQYSQCEKAARPGCLTCWWHRGREDAALRLQERLKGEDNP